MPAKAAKLKRTRAQRIPFRPGVRYSNRGRIHSRRPILSSSFFACKTAADHTFRMADYTDIAWVLGPFPLVIRQEYIGRDNAERLPTLDKYQFLKWDGEGAARLCGGRNR